jgi:transcription elongation GreA/GreB family factor
MKKALVEKLIASIKEEIERATKQAKDAAEGATHADNKPEGDKDMRSTEASYIARGQAARVAETVEALARLESMPVKEFGDGAKIESSALVDVEHDGKESTFLIVPAAGGRTLELGDEKVLTLATTSPLGRALLGLSEGDDAEVKTPQGLRTHSILRVR